MSSVVAVFVRPSGPASQLRKARIAVLLELKDKLVSPLFSKSLAKFWADEAFYYDR